MLPPAHRTPALRRALHVVIGGGPHGFLSGSVGTALLQHGHHVYFISRHATSTSVSATASASARSQCLTWSPLRLPPRIDAVVNLCGCNVLNPLRRWTRAFKAQCVASRIDTITKLGAALAARTQKPPVWVQVSGVGFHGAVRDAAANAPLDEDAPAGAGYWSEFAQRVEQHASSVGCAQDVSLRMVLLRCGVVLGRSGGALASMLPVFRAGLGGPIGSGKQPFPWIHVDDVVGLVEHAIATPAVDGALLAVAPQPLTNAEFTAALAAAVRRPALVRVPEWAMKLVYGSVRSSLLLEGPLATPKKALQTGYQFAFPSIEKALEDIVQ